MANNTAKVTTGKGKVGGYIYWAPAATALPTDATTALATEYKCLGYISDDGVTVTTNTSSAEIKDWNGDTVLNTQTEYSAEAAFKLIEFLNADALKAAFGSDNVTESDGAITVSFGSGDIPAAVWVFECIFNGDKPGRWVFPNGVITEHGDITLKADEAVGIDLTVNALPDSRIDNDCHKLYIGA